MGRDFPAADETGASDPFIIARCQGKKTKTKVKYETLNPGFFETIEMVVSLPPIGDSNVRLVLLTLNSVSLTRYFPAGL